MTETLNLCNERVLITGGGSGLGLAMAEGLGRAGASLILNGRNPEKLQEAATMLAGQGIEVETAAFDITSEVEATKSVESLLDHGPITVLINNAGVQRRAPLLEMSLEDFESVLSTNLTAAFLMARLVVPTMMEAGGGKVINMGSLMCELARPSTGNYAAAKGGLRMLTRAMCAEWAAKNIQVNAIAPGYFITDMTRPLAENPQFNEWICGRTPAGRWGDPSELAGLAVFLASPASSYVNGQVFFVDGGLSAVI